MRPPQRSSSTVFRQGIFSRIGTQPESSYLVAAPIFKKFGEKFRTSLERAVATRRGLLEGGRPDRGTSGRVAAHRRVRATDVRVIGALIVCEGAYPDCERASPRAGTPFDTCSPYCVLNRAPYAYYICLPIYRRVCSCACTYVWGNFGERAYVTSLNTATCPIMISAGRCTTLPV